MVFNSTILNNDLCNSAISRGLQIYNKCSLTFNIFTPLSYLINFPLKLPTCYPKPKRQNMYPISDQKSKFNTLFQIRSAWTWHPQLIPNVCDLICSQLHILSGEMAEFCTSHWLYQNNSFIVRLPLQSWTKLCGTLLQNALPRPSIVFHMETNVLSGPNSTFPSSLHAMLFKRKG